MPTVHHISGYGWYMIVLPTGHTLHTVDGCEILHHPGLLKAFKYWDKPPINWCRILQPSAIACLGPFRERRADVSNSRGSCQRRKRLGEENNTGDLMRSYWDLMVNSRDVKKKTWEIDRILMGFHGT